MGKKEWKKIRHGIIIFVMAFFSAIPFVVYGKNIDSQETIRIGYIDYGGFIDLDENGEYTGYGVELLDKIAEYTGWKYEYVYDTWDNILKKLESGEIDMICQAQRTPEREERFLLSKYWAGTEACVLYARMDDDRYYYNDFEAFNGIPLLLAGLEKPHGILAKEELEKIPLLNRWMKLLGCVFVQRDDVRASVRALNDATAIVEGGRSFVIFPEGTRYKGEEGGAGEFKAGAFRIAVKTGAPVVPVAVTGARALFEANGNRCRPGSVRIKIMSPIQTAGMSKAEQKQLPDAVRQSILAALK